MVESENWQIEYYDGPGSTFETWMDSLDDINFAALSAAVDLVLAAKGMALIGTPWLKHVEKGIFEFRIKYSAADIKAMYASVDLNGPVPQAKILLRLFIHFHGKKIILLLNGYDKSANDKSNMQQAEIKLAKQRLQRWRANQK